MASSPFEYICGLAPSMMKKIFDLLMDRRLDSSEKKYQQHTSR
jgi:hypothetical protein